MAFPNHNRWPNWLKHAETYIGTKEISGPRHNTQIQRWLVEMKAWWKDDETPWCGVFVGVVLKETGLHYPSAYYRAASFINYGNNLRTDRLSPGAILVFRRRGGFHVCFYISESPTHYQVLGGNQGNEVNISSIPKGSLVASRWPSNQPVVLGPVRLTMNPPTARVSTSQA